MKINQDKESVQKLSNIADKSLLIVDDDNPLRDRLARAMEKKGFIVTQAESVKMGISLASSSGSKTRGRKWSRGGEKDS